MKTRFLVFLLVAALAAPAGARPVSAARHATVWTTVWQGFLGFVRGFHLFDAPGASQHDFPPPNCTTMTLFQ